MTSPTGTIHPATMTMPGRYYPINSHRASSRVPGRGKAFQGSNLPFMSLSQQAHNRPSLDTGTSFAKPVPNAKGPA
jgi:hypothetical protein